MKKFISLFLILLMLAALGCTQRKIAANNSGGFVHSELNNAPNWVRAPNYEGGIAAIGSQKIGAAGIDITRKNAIASARDSLANSIEIKVKNVIKNTTKSSGICSDETVDRVSEHTSKQTSFQLLRGSRHVDTWISPSGELYTLVVIGELEKVKNTVRSNSISSFKKESALWQQFQANKAFKELDREIDREFGN